jgi:hypothetical protein
MQILIRGVKILSQLHSFIRFAEFIPASLSLKTTYSQLLIINHYRSEDKK